MVSLCSRNWARVRPSLRVATVARTKGYLEITVSGMVEGGEAMDVEAVEDWCKNGWLSESKGGVGLECGGPDGCQSALGLALKKWKW